MVTAALRPDRFLRRTLPALAAAAAVLVAAARTDAFTPGSGGWGFSAVLLHGRVWTWGQNGYGQLGTGNLTWTTAPVQVPGLANVTDLAVGADHVLARRSDGTVWAWGRNNFGQLGVGDTVDRSSPVQVPGLTNIVAVGAGWYHSFAISTSGQLYAWGRNDMGQLGLGDATNRATPVAVPGMASVYRIAAGPHHTAAIMTDLTVRTWGFNGAGQLGLGDTVNRLAPVQVPGMTSVHSVSAGYGHTVLTRSNGTVWAFGQNDQGQLGLGDTVNRLSPVQVPGITGASVADAGSYHTVVRLGSGAVLTWGANWYGQLGLGDTANRLSPVQVPGISAVSLVSAGDRHTLAQRSDGSVWAWGGNDQGQLGVGDTVNRLTPVLSLLDTVAPGVTFTSWSPLAISPNGDGVQEQASISYTLSEPATVTAQVTNSQGTAVRTFAAGQLQSGTVAVTWNGRNDAGQVAPDGQYRLDISATDAAGNGSFMSSAWLAVDTVAPPPANLAVTPAAISPNGDGVQDAAVVSFTLSETARVTVRVRNAGGQVVRTLWNAVVQSQGPTQVTWNGRNDAGSPVPDGQYTVTVDLLDNAGNVSPTATATATVDRVAPALTNLTASPAVISPNGDGIQDGTALSFTISEAAAVTVEVKDAGGQVVRTLWQQLPRQAGSHTVDWDGKDGSGTPVPAGAYTAAVRAVDVAGNAAAGAAPVTVEAGTLEVTAPAAFAWNASLTGQDLAVLDWKAVAVADQTGTGAGWRLLLELAPLQTSGGEPLTGATLQVNGSAASPSASAAPQAGCAAQGSCVAPAPAGITYPVVITPGAPPVRVYNAASGTGLGSMLVDGAFWLRVPARAKAGTYSGTLTFSVASGP